MAARKISIAAASSGFVAASVVYSASIASRTQREDRAQNTGNTLFHSKSDKEQCLLVHTMSTSTTDRATADIILDEAGKDIRWCIKNFNEVAGSTLIDTKVRAMVAAWRRMPREADGQKQG